MHELGVAESILNTAIKVAEDNNAKTITKIQVKVGTLSGVEPYALQFALNAIKDGTIAQNADMEMNIIKAVGRCNACGKDSEPDTFYSICEYCNDPMLEIVAGEEFEIEFVDVE
jgi:hydrogenase nickel incorporation protein HypA/HybF